MVQTGVMNSVTLFALNKNRFIKKITCYKNLIIALKIVLSFKS